MKWAGPGYKWVTQLWSLKVNINPGLVCLKYLLFLLINKEAMVMRGGKKDEKTCAICDPGLCLIRSCSPKESWENRQSPAATTSTQQQDQLNFKGHHGPGATAHQVKKPVLNWGPQKRTWWKQLQNCSGVKWKRGKVWSWRQVNTSYLISCKLKFQNEQG